MSSEFYINVGSDWVLIICFLSLLQDNFACYISHVKMHNVSQFSLNNFTPYIWRTGKFH